MGTGFSGTRIIGLLTLLGSAFVIALMLVTPVMAASPASGIIDLVNKRLYERQKALGSRLPIRLIAPEKCAPKPEPQLPTVTLTASPTSITVGQSTTLTWTSSSATSCTAFLGWTGSKTLSGSQVVSPTETTTYQLDCTGPGGVGSDDAVVTVTVVEPNEPTLELTANPMNLNEGSAGNATTTLSWNSTNATSCTASNGWSGGKAVDGSEIVEPTATTSTTYVLTCTGDGGSVTDSVTVTVTPEPDAPILNFTSSTSTVREGSTSEATSTLTWDSSNATSCTASNGWTGGKSLDGSQLVEPTGTTTITYTLTCTGAGGSVAQSVTLTVIPAPEAPTLELTANPMSLVEDSAGNATTTLTWDSTNASSCVASNAWSGSKAADGTEIIEPTATTSVTYTLTCTGAGGDATDSVTITVSPPVATVNHLLISEVHYDPTAEDGADDNEWVEIFNPTASAINLSTWGIGDTATSGIDMFPNGTMIQAGQYLIVSSASTTLSFWSLPGGAAFVSLEESIGSGLSNTGDAVFLVDITGATTTVDAMSYGTNTVAFSPAAPDVIDGHSLARSVLTSDLDTAADWIDNASPTFGF